MLLLLDRDLTKLEDRPTLNLNPSPPDKDLQSPYGNATELLVSIQLDIGTLDRDLLDKCKDPPIHGLIRHKTVVAATTASLAK